MSEKFYKLEGLGNDFILFDCRDKELELSPELVKKLCRRRFGIGADGILLLLPSQIPSAQWRMRIFNADGSEAEMCGNGIRCLAHYLELKGEFKESELAIQTLAGLVRIEKRGGWYRVAMGSPEFSPEKIPLSQSEPMIDQELQVAGEKLRATAVSMGNPHCVILVEELEGFPVSELGAKVETHPLFPNRTNVEFVQVLSPQKIKVRVWERGAGETLACGTGACAVLAACARLGKTESRAEVLLPGGKLEIEWKNDICYLTGLARLVYQGALELADF